MRAATQLPRILEALQGVRAFTSSASVQGQYAAWQHMTSTSLGSQLGQSSLNGAFSNHIRVTQRFIQMAGDWYPKDTFADEKTIQLEAPFKPKTPVNTLAPTEDIEDLTPDPYRPKHVRPQVWEDALKEHNLYETPHPAVKNYIYHGGPETKPYATLPSRERYSAMWEYETYRRLPTRPNEVHEGDHAMYAHQKRFAHVVLDPSPWPGFVSLCAGGMLNGVIMYFNFAMPNLFLVGFFGVLYGCSMWWRDVVREALLEGKHTLVVKSQYRMAFAMFIASEVMIFATIFWTYFHNYSNAIWVVYPEEMLMKGWGLPILNTFLLLSSGAAVTWSHHAVICAKELVKKAPK